jgi:hypothetical protein
LSRTCNDVVSAVKETFAIILDDFNRGFNLPCADAKSSVWRCDGGCRFDNQGAHGEAVSLLMARRNLR